MLKTKNAKAALIVVVIFSMIAIYGYTPSARAAITEAKDTISNSRPSASGVTHTISFNLGTPLASSDKIVITFPAGFTGINVDNVTCPANTNKSVSGQEVICTATGAVSGHSTTTITNVTNPSDVGDYTIIIQTKNSSDVIIEETEVKVYIIDSVIMDARVPANLTFTISGLTSGQTINGMQTTVSSTATTTSFGTLNTSASSTVGQELTVSTNAGDGFIVTVQQSGNLSSAGGADIDSFKDGTVPGSPENWASPSANMSDENTWGHMGFTSSDSDYFGTGQYTGFDGSNPKIVLSHNGPANGTGNGQGLVRVGYTVEISALQEAGDYQTTLTYICTPQF